MISLRYFVYILFTVCLREASEDLATPNAAAVLWSVLGSTMGFGLMIKVAAYQVARRVTTDGITQLSDAPIDYQLRRRQIEWLWCLTMPLTMFLCGYLQWTHWIADSVGLPAAGLVFCFLPAILFLFLAEISSAQVDEFLASQFCTTARSGVGWRQALITRLRLGETAGLVTCMFPVILLASVFESSDPVADSLGLSASWLRVLLGICLVMGTLLAMPALMTVWSNGQPLPADFASRLNQQLADLKIGKLQCVLIPSEGRWNGAAVVGWIPGFRKLWIGDGLLQSLNRRQLELVVLHEVAHLTRFHFLWRLMPAMGVLLASVIAWSCLDLIGWQEGLLEKTLIGLMAGGLLIAGLGWMARSCELDADRTACTLAVQTLDWAGDHCPAEILGSALRVLLPHSKDRQSTWLHPSLEQRLLSLRTWQLRRHPELSAATAGKTGARFEEM